MRNLWVGVEDESGEGLSMKRVVTPADLDLDAAAEVVARLLGDKLHDEHETKGPCRGCRQDAEAIVEAAIAHCDHNWVDARNEAVSSGEWCPKCNAIR